MAKLKSADHVASDAKRFETISTVILGVLAVIALLPIILIVIASFTDETTLLRNGYSFFPEKWSMDGMNAVFKYGKQLFTSYAVTIFVTVTGTLLGLLIMSMYAYSISRKGFRLSAVEKHRDQKVDR